MTGIFSRLTLIALVLFGALFLPGKSYAANNPKSPSIEDQLSRIAAGPANQIDLVETLLLISRHWDPTIDPEFLRGKLISLTASVKERMADDPSPKKVVDILKQIIHKDYGYGYTNFVDPAGIPLDASELFIHGLLNKKRGYCMNLSLLYLVLGEKLELPLYGVALPNHFFVRYDSPDHRVNIETTQGGISLPDSYYYKRFNLSQSPPPSFFMQNLGRKESLGAYFSNVGMVYYKNSKTDRAVFYLKLAAKINKLSLEAHNNLGNIYSELKQLDKAIRQYQMALEADPKSMETHFNMGIAYMDKGETPKAVESFKKVLRINPVFSPAHEILANHFMARKNYDQALTHLEKLVEIDTRNIKAREWLAEAFYRKESFDKAIQQYQTLLNLNPGMVKAYVQLGWTYYRKGLLQKAIDSTLRAFRSNERNPVYRKLAEMNLGFYHVLTKDYGKAEQWYQKTLTPPDPRNLETMVADLKDAAESFPERNELDYFSGWLYFEFGKDEQAKQALHKYLSREPRGILSRKAYGLLRKMEPDYSPYPMKSIRENIPANPLEHPIPEGMVIVPRGFFIMGSNNHGEDERPEHKVYLDSFYIDKFEISAGQYAEFLNKTNEIKGINLKTKYGTVTFDGKAFRTRAGFESYPVNTVNWYGADAYCRWKGKRLPTEAEWEKAARGTGGRIYPWGNQPPRPGLARFRQTWTDEIGHKVMAPVDSMPEGKSPYGIYHMAGNAKEWVDDWFDREYYGENHKINPQSPMGGEFKVLKGGSWRDLTIFIYSSFRNNSYPSGALDDYGFRCAKIVPGENAPKQFTQMDFHLPRGKNDLRFAQIPW